MIAIKSLLLLLTVASIASGDENEATIVYLEEDVGKVSPLDWIYSDFVSQGVQEERPTAGLGWKDGGKLLVEVVASNEGAEELLGPAFRATDFEVTACSQYVCDGWLPMDNYPALKDRREVRDIRPLYRATQQAGSKVSEALDSLRVDLVRQGLDMTLTGAGLRIGILSDSFNTATTPVTNYAADITSGDLPNNVNILKDLSGGSDEGRAMAQLVYDLIPGVDISFYTAVDGPNDFANGIQALADDGCDVIVDDVVYFAEPFFLDGTIAQSANLVASQRNVPYFSSAGNNAKQSWQDGPFAPSGAFDLNGCPFHDFSGDGDFLQSVVFKADPLRRMAIVLQWDDPWFSISGTPGAASDVNLFLLQGGIVRVSDRTMNTGVDAVASIEVPSDGTFQIAISVCSGPAPTLFKWIANRGTVSNIEYDTQSSTSFGHPNGAFTAGVGAAFFQNTPEFGVNPPLLEDFSSRGGTPILFETNGTRKTAAETRNQPRFVATDGNINTFFGRAANFTPNGDGFYFFGTSAAAPNAAAVAILMLQANPSLTPLEIYQILEDTAIDMNTPGFDFDSGFGYIDALAAIIAAKPASSPGPSQTPSASPEPSLIPSNMPSTSARPSIGPSETPNTSAKPSLAKGKKGGKKGQNGKKGGKKGGEKGHPYAPGKKEQMAMVVDIAMHEP